MKSSLPSIRDVVARLRKEFYQRRYMSAIGAGISKLRPLSKGDVPFVLLSMVHTRDVLSYLVAAHTFAAKVCPQRVVVVCDPSITDADRATLTASIPHIELRHADEFTHADIPRGGCWERLYAISEYVQSAYVVQLDADTVTLKGIADVRNAILAGQGFVLGEEPQQRLWSLSETSAFARGRLQTIPHVQTYAEAAMEDIGLPSGSLYVRGCAGFTGFPKSSDMRQKLTDFSARMSAKLGRASWASWGTEQVTSNYLVSNAPQTTVLPFPQYGTPDVAGAHSEFLHFIGSMRFINDEYRNQSIGALGHLTQTGT